MEGYAGNIGAGTSRTGQPSRFAFRGGGSRAKRFYIPEDPLEQERIGDVDIPKPDKLAQGRPHTTLGGKMGQDGVKYRQSATFPQSTWPLTNGSRGGQVPWSRVDWSTHGRPTEHSCPHQHVFQYNWIQKRWELGGPEDFSK
jgi:hypothetical protein